MMNIYSSLTRRIKYRGSMVFSLFSGHPLSRDAVIYALSKVVPGAAGLLAVVLFVRLVGLDEYGKFALWFALISMVSSFCGGWVNQAQLRFVRDSNKQDGAWLLAVIIATIFSVVAVEVCVFLAVWVKSGTIIWDSGILSYGLVGAAMVIHATRITALQAGMQAQRVLNIETLRGFLGLALPLGIAWGIRQDHVGLMAGFAMSYMIAVALSCYSTQNRKNRITEVDMKRVRDFLAMFWRFGRQLSVWAGIRAAFPVMDRYIIQHFLGYVATGQYAATSDIIVRSFSLLLFPVVLSAHPRIMTAANAGNGDESSKLIRQAMVLQVVVFLPVLFILVLGGKSLVDAILPGKAGLSLEIVLLLALSGFLWQISLLVHKPLEIKCRVDIMLLALGISLFINAAVGVWGAPRFGLKALAVASVLASMSYIFSCVGFMRLLSVQRR